MIEYANIKELFPLYACMYVCIHKSIQPHSRTRTTDYNRLI